MKVLVISPTPSHPFDQGNRVRVTQICSALQKYGSDVDFLYYNLDGLDTSSINAMRSKWGRVYVVGTDGFSFHKTYPHAWGVDDWISPKLIEAVRYLSEATSYDIVLVNYVWCSLCLDVFSSKVIKIIDTHDAFGNRHILARQSGIDPGWFYTTVEEEARGLNRANYVVAIQEKEGRYFSGLTKSKIQVIEYAPEPDFLPSMQRQKVVSGYLGSGNPWNVKSVRSFDSELSMAKASAVSADDLAVLLFGSITKNIGRLENFRSIGTIEATRDFYALCDLTINPMINGTGLKIKTVESLSFGRPIITTVSGAEGLTFINNDLVCNDLRAAAVKLCDLHNHPDKVAKYADELQSAYRNYHHQCHERLTEGLRTWFASVNL